MIAVAALLAWVWLLLLHGRFWQTGPELPVAQPTMMPSVVAVVPARDEAACVGAAVGSLLAQDYAGEFRVVLVDDGSTDATAAIARALPGADRLTVVEGAPRPAGWAGKPWAMQQGVAAAADAEWLLLTDADIVHEPAHLATLLAAAERSGVDLLSEMVRLNCASFAERALVPAFVYFFQLLYPFEWVNDPLRATAGAAGGTMLVRRAALERAGGIAAIREALIDDCALAARLKRGGRIWLGHTALARSIRPYPGVADIWRMIARSAYVQLRRSPLLLIASLAGLFFLFWVPPLAALHGHGTMRAAGWLGWAAMAVSFAPSVGRFGLGRGWTWGSAVALPLIAAFYMAATIGSALNHHRGCGVTWKRRAYTGPAA